MGRAIQQSFEVIRGLLLVGLLASCEVVVGISESTSSGGTPAAPAPVPAPVASNLSSIVFNEDSQSVITLSYSVADGAQATACEISNLSHLSITQACNCVFGICTVGITGMTHYNGAATFEYTLTVNGQTSNSAMAIINIAAVDQAPVAAAISPVGFNEDTQSVITLSYTDVDSDEATSCTVSNLLHLSVTQACACSAGICTVGVTGTSNYFGAASFDYSVSSNGQTSNTAIATLSLVDVAETLESNLLAIQGVTLRDLSTWNGTFADSDTWNRSFYVSTPQKFSDYVPQLAFDVSGHMYMGFYRGFAFSSDQGLHWTFADLSNYIVAGSFHSVVSVSQDADTIFLGIVGKGVIKIKLSMQSIGYIAALDSLKNYTGNWQAARVMVSPFHSNFMMAYAGHEDSGGSMASTLFKSLDGGNTWTNLDAAMHAAGAHGVISQTSPVGFDPDSTDIFYTIAMPEGAYQTTNGGTSFNHIGNVSYDAGIFRTFDGTNKRVAMTGACAALQTSIVGIFSWVTTINAVGGCGGTGGTPVAHPLDLRKVVGERGGVRYSTDGALSYSMSNMSGGTAFNNLPSANPYVAGEVFFWNWSTYGSPALSLPFKIYKSTDWGANFQIVSDMPGINIAP